MNITLDILLFHGSYEAGVWISRVRVLVLYEQYVEAAGVFIQEIHKKKSGLLQQAEHGLYHTRICRIGKPK